jgi:hypothetical protein
MKDFVSPKQCFLNKIECKYICKYSGPVHCSMCQSLPMTTHICQRLFSTLVTDNFQRSFSSFDGNALTSNAYMVGEKWQRTTNNGLFAINKNF